MNTKFQQAQEYAEKKMENVYSQEWDSEYVEGLIECAFEDGYTAAEQSMTDSEATVIQGWVCRDKEWDKVLFASDLYLSAKKPKRDEYCGAWCNMVSYMPLKTELFPNLTWDDDPIEVEIIIKRKKK